MVSLPVNFRTFRIVPRGCLVFALSFAPAMAARGVQPPDASTQAKGEAPSQPSNDEATLPSDPVVARVEMKLAAGSDVLDIIEKGDLLTVLEDRGEKYVIQTFSGRKGIVSKTNAVLLAESSEIYSQLIAERPSEGRLYTLRASSWWALGDGAKALADFDKAIASGYDTAHAFASRGLFHASVGSLDKAIADFSVAIEKSTDDPTNYINRAAAHVSSGNFVAAITDYDSAIKLKPKNAAMYQQRAVAKKLAGMLDEAIQDFTFVLELEPKSVPALLGRGFVHYQQKANAKAIEDFTKVIELDPEDAIAYNNRGHNRQQIGLFQEALADYNQAVKLAPNYGLALQNLAWLLATVEDDKLRDTKRAIEAAKQACQLSEFKNVSDIAALAAALAADGEFDLAVEWQTKVVEQADISQREYTQRILDRYKTRLPFDSSLIPKLNSEEDRKP